MHSYVVAALLLVQASLPSLNESCSAKIASPVAITLADGREVLLNDRTITPSGTAQMILGPPAYIFPNTWKNGKVDSIFGVLRRGKGFSAIERPSSRAEYPQAISDNRGGWDVLYVENQSRNYKKWKVADSATIFYGHYDGDRWSRIQIVSSVSDVQIQPDFTSSLARVGDEIFWLLPFESRRGVASGNRQGVLVVRWSTVNKRSRLDTLFTSQSPGYVRLLSAETGKLSAFVTQDYYSDGSFKPNALFRAELAGEWGLWEKFQTNSVVGFFAPTILFRNGSYLVTWVESVSGAKDVEVRISEKRRDGEPRDLPSIIRTPAFHIPATVVTSRGRVIWLAISPGPQKALQVFVERTHGLQFAGSFHIPLETFTPVAVASTGNTILLTTAGRGAAIDRSLPHSFIYELTINCD